MRQWICENDIWGEKKNNLTKPTWSWFQAQRGAAPKPGENSRSEEGAENWVCSVCLCAACVWALIKDRRFFKHIRAILSNCFTPSSISTHRKDTGCSTKWCSPALRCTITTSRPSTDTNTGTTKMILKFSHKKREESEIKYWYISSRYKIFRGLECYVFLSNSHKWNTYITSRAVQTLTAFIHKAVAALIRSVIDMLKR